MLVHRESRQPGYVEKGGNRRELVALPSRYSRQIAQIAHMESKRLLSRTSVVPNELGRGVV